MPFQILRNDITQMKVDAIVNTVSPEPGIGWGVDAGVHKKAGPMLLLERRKLGRLKVGSAAVTRAFDLPSRFVIHTVGPVWQDGTRGEQQLLRSCYDECLRLAKKKGCESIAFPLISAGNHGFPKSVALSIALDAIRDFILKEEMLVYLVVYSHDAFALSEKVFRDVHSFIDDNYTQENDLLQYGVADKCQLRYVQQKRILEAQNELDVPVFSKTIPATYDAAHAPDMWDEAEDAPPEAAPCPISFSRGPEPRDTMPLPCAPAPKEAMPLPSMAPSPRQERMPKKSVGYSMPVSLQDMLRQEDVGFSQRLLQLIDRTGKKDSAIYSRANVTRQHFSKIRNDPGYKPTKATALAFAIALELDMEETRDLIGRAGFALTRSSKFDLIVMYFIQSGNYDIFAINAALFEFDQKLLGA